MNNEDFCLYEIAMRLKQAGFDRPCCYYYSKENASEGYVWITTSTFSPENWNNGRNSEPDFLKPLCSAPTLAQAQKWLREKGYVIEPRIWLIGSTREYRPYIMPPKKRDYIVLPPHATYESALSAGITAVLTLIEEDYNDNYKTK